MTRSIKKGLHKSAKAQSIAYSTQAKFIKNRRATLERHVKKFPNDAQSVAALNDLNTTYKQRAGSFGFKEPVDGYQVVATEKRKNRQGKMIEVSIYRNVSKPVQRSNAEKKGFKGSFYALEARCVLEKAA